ncbi:MAG: hypothetical protein ACHQ53_07265 [Polyangiales bacterium]
MSHSPKARSAPKQLGIESALPTRFLRIPSRQASDRSSGEPATRKYAAAELASLLGAAPKVTHAAPPSQPVPVKTVIAPSPFSKRPRKATRLWRAPAARLLLLIGAPLVGAALTLLGLSLAAHRTPVVLGPAASVPVATPRSPTPHEPTMSAPPDGARLNDPPPPTPTSATPTDGVAALAEGRYADALSVYRALAIKQPERDAYTVVARVLERKLQARCEKHTEAGAIPCSSPSD